MILGPKPYYYPYYICSTDNKCLSGIVQYPAVSAIGISNATTYNIYKEKNIIEAKNLIHNIQEYSSFKKDSIKIIKSYLIKYRCKQFQECIDILNLYHDDLIYEVVLFLNKKNRKISLFKFLKEQQKKVLDKFFVTSQCLKL